MCDSSCFFFLGMRCLPSPLVAQLGSTFQTWSLAILSRSRAWATSLGRIATKECNQYLRHCYCSENELKPTAIDILLVGENEEDDVAHFAVLDNTAEFGFSLFHAGPVARVNHED